MESQLSSLGDVVNEKIQLALDAGRNILPEPEAKSLLSLFDIQVPSSVVIENETQVDYFLTSLPGPYVVKAVGKTIVHKTEIGAVKVGLTDFTAVRQAIVTMRKQVAAAGHNIDAFLVETMQNPGVELVLGAVRRHEIGWVVMIGLGGVFVEVLEDVSFGIAPFDQDYVERMLSQLRGAKILDGVRGDKGVNRQQLLDVVTAFAGEHGFLSHLPAEVSEVDLNPVICTSSGCVAVDARIMLQSPACEAQVLRGTAKLKYDRMLYPKAIAVLGASESSPGMANDFIQRTRAYGYAGTIYPVHRQADTIEGLKAYRTLDDIPEPVDYAYVALPSKAVSPRLACAPGKLAVAQIASSGFSEIADGSDLQGELALQARRSQFRYLGPNCLGMHAVNSKVTFLPAPSPDEGHVAVISQSGGLSVDIVSKGTALGVKFKTVLSVGNSEDVTPAELLQFMLQDPEIKVIGMYLESLSDAVDVQRVLAASKTQKPVVLLAGGRTQMGADSAASHTGALVSDYKLWPAIAGQAGMHLVDSLHDFVYLLATFECVPAEYAPLNRDVILFGNGGGSSVLGSDALSEAGLGLSNLSEEVVTNLETLGNLVGSSLTNPIDVPAPVLSKNNGELAENILRLALGGDSPAAAVIIHLNVGVIAANARGSVDVTQQIVNAMIRVQDHIPNSTSLLLVLRSDGTSATDELIRRYVPESRRAGVPVFDEISTAATAADALIRHYLQRS